MGVSISRKPSSARNCLVRIAILLRRIRFLWISGLLRSRKRYFKRSSSFVLEFSSMGKGGVSDSERIRRLSARTSIPPVARFSLTPPDRASTFPVTAMTNSLLSFSAFAKLCTAMGPFQSQHRLCHDHNLLLFISRRALPPLFAFSGIPPILMLPGRTPQILCSLLFPAVPSGTFCSCSSGKPVPEHRRGALPSPAS